MGESELKFGAKQHGQGYKGDPAYEAILPSRNGSRFNPEDSDRTRM